MGGRYLSPMVKQDLAKLDKGPESRRSALVSLRACVEQLDQVSMPRFLAQVSDTRDLNESRSYAISLYEDVARVHGKLIAQHIPRIMATVIRSLSSSGSSIHLQEACSKVVASILRYSICPASSTSEIEGIFHDLCNPLVDVLLGKLEPLAAGAAICLQAVVESEKWKYAPHGMVNDFCSKCTLALKERTGQTVAHMQLARSLARMNVVKPDCGVQLLRAAKEILQWAATWQHRASALQLLRALMASLDKKIVTRELESIGEILEHLRLDRMPHVRKEAVKTLQTLKVLALDEDNEHGTTSLLSDGTDLRKPPRCRSLWELSASSNYSSQESQLISYSPPTASSKTPSTVSTPMSSSSTCASAAKPKPKRYPLFPAEQAATPRTSTSSSASDDSDFYTGYAPSESKENMPVWPNSDNARNEVSDTSTDKNLRFQSSLDPVTDHNQAASAGDNNNSIDCAVEGGNDICLVEQQGHETFCRMGAAESLGTGVSDDDKTFLDGDRGHGHIVGALVNRTSAKGELSGDESIVHLKRLSELRDADDLASCTPSKSRLESYSSPQRTSMLLTADDFFKFTTPRRLVRSLQSSASSPDTSVIDPAGKEDEEMNRATDLELETSSETGWSVRDNPIAEESDEDMFVAQNKARLESLRAAVFESELNKKEDSGRLNDDELKQLVAVQREPETPPPCSDRKQDEDVAGWPKSIQKLALAHPHSTWKRMRGCIEMLLGGCLCLVLLLPLAMVAIQLFNPQEDFQALVPT